MSTLASNGSQGFVKLHKGLRISSSDLSDTAGRNSTTKFPPDAGERLWFTVRLTRVPAERFRSTNHLKSPAGVADHLSGSRDAQLAAPDRRVKFPPLLPAGFHSTDLAGLQRLCLDYFPRSRTRPKLMNTVSMVVSLVNRVSIPSRLWVGDAFVTEEEDPERCSLILVLVESVFERLTPEQREFFDWFREVSLFEKYHCDNYAIVLDAQRVDYETVNAFWLRQFGFHDKARRQGVPEILLPVVSGT